MFRALYTAASGMNAQQLNLDNVANNLANTSTAGFRRRRVQFTDLLYQNMVMPGSAATQQTTNAPAHVGLARFLEATRDYATARAEARAALQLRPSVDAFLVLARLDLRDNDPQAAQESVNRALALDPGNADAQALRRAVAAKLTEKAQPLPPR